MVVKSAFLAILRNKFRSALTSIGIIVGIAAVVAVMAIGAGASTMMRAQFEELGTNLIAIQPSDTRIGRISRGGGSGDTLTPADAAAIGTELKALVRGVSPVVSKSCQLIRERNNWSVSVMGVSTDYPSVHSHPVGTGRAFDDTDQRLARRVCVIGTTVRDHLFGPDFNPVGQLVRIDAMAFRIVGLLVKKGTNAMGQDQDDIVYVPYTSASAVLKGSPLKSVDSILVATRKPEQIPETKRLVTELLRQRHRLASFQENDFLIRDSDEALSMLAQVMLLVRILLAAVAAISLLVGGIGIMNIMLVSVTERLKEIGLRVAIGAPPASVLGQFLVEAIVLSTTGGVIGVVVGAVGAELVGRLNHWPIVVEPFGATVAFTFSVIVGVFFGFYPAYRASKLNPIQCLKSE